MNFYKTEFAAIEMQEPRQTRNMKAEQIVAYLREHYQTNIDRQTGKSRPANKVTEYAMNVFNAVKNPADWKAPFYASMPQFDSEWVKAVTMWYHGNVPVASFAGVYSYGYAC